MKNKTAIILGVIAILIIVLVLVIVKVTSAKDVPAVLYIEKGDVEVFHKSQWMKGVDEQELFLEDKVRTGQDGEATIVFYDSIITRLQPNSEITIQELKKEGTSIKQAAGETWNRFEDIAGVKKFEVETPNAVATVRGTGYLVTLNQILVEDGEVDVDLLKDGNRVESQRVTAGKKIFADIEAGKLVLSDLTPEDKERLKAFLIKDRDTLKRVRLFLARNDPKIIAAAKMANVDMSKAEEYAERLDNGEWNEDELYEKSPVKTSNVEKIYRLTKKIKAYNQLIKQMQE